MMENLTTDEDMIESSSADRADGQEQEAGTESEETMNGSGQETEPEGSGQEQEKEPEESEQGPDPEEAVPEVTQGCSCDMPELAAYMETLQCDVRQMASSLDTIRMSCTSVIFLLLFIWSERKIKAAVTKISGGKKNADIG